MKMLGHQNPADEQEMQLLPHLLESLDKTPPKAVGEEKRHAMIGAGHDELEFTGTVNTGRLRAADLHEARATNHNADSTQGAALAAATQGTAANELVDFRFAPDYVS